MKFCFLIDNHYMSSSSLTGELEPVIIDFGLSLYKSTSLLDLAINLPYSKFEASAKWPHMPIEAVTYGRLDAKSDLFTLGYELNNKLAHFFTSKKLVALCQLLMEPIPEARLNHTSAKLKLNKVIAKMAKKENGKTFGQRLSRVLRLRQ